MEFNPTRAVVHNEGCDLHYWYQGSGPLMVFVPGGNGHGLQFDKLVAAMSDRYTCASFDRRQMSASKVKVEKRLNPYQQARDIVAIIRAVGFDKATVFGSSLGGLLGFVLAAEHPDSVEHLIAHEAPTAALLDDYPRLFEWFLEMLEVRDASGWEAANEAFRSEFIGYDAPGVPPIARGGPENTRNFWENEFATGTTFSVNLAKVAANGVSVGVMRGQRSGEAFFARATEKQAELLGCLKMDVPGHHQGFEAETEAFLPYFERMLAELKERKAATAKGVEGAQQ